MHMHEQFIKKAKELEQDFINGDIKINTLLDWNDLKKRLWNLGDLWAEEENEKTSQEEKKPVTLKNCKSFVGNLFYAMKKMEQKEKTMSNEDLKLLVYQLRVLVEYNFLVAYPKELAENYTLEKEQNPALTYIDIADNFGISYRIKESDKENFENSCRKQKKQFEEYRQVHTCVYKETKEQIKLLEEYNQDTEKYMYSIINNEMKIVTLNQWRIFKNSVNNFKKNFDALTTNIIKGKRLQLGENLYKTFIDLLLNCIHEIEIRYNGQISEEDLPFIMEKIWILCKYQSLTLEKVNIHRVKTSIEDEQMEKVEISAVNKSLKLTPAQAEIYSKIDKEQNELKEKYKEVIQFVFRDSMDEKESKKMSL